MGNAVFESIEYKHLCMAHRHLIPIVYINNSNCCYPVMWVRQFSRDRDRDRDRDRSRGSIDEGEAKQGS